MPRKQKLEEQTPKKKTKEKSPKKSEDPKLDEAELNRLAAIAEQNLEDRITALREEIEKKHQEEMIAFKLQDQFAQSRGANPTTQEKQVMRGLMVDAVVAANHKSHLDRKPNVHRFGARLTQTSPSRLDHYDTCSRSGV